MKLESCKNSTHNLWKSAGKNDYEIFSRRSNFHRFKRGWRRDAIVLSAFSKFLLSACFLLLKKVSVLNINIFHLLSINYTF